MMKNSRGEIRVNGKVSEELDINIEVRQGDELAPVLFNLALEAAS